MLITGASTGIGHATAVHLDSLGFRVFAGIRRESDGEALRALCSERLEPVILDVTDQDTVRAAAARIDAASPGGLAGLVNNAGIAVGGPLEFVPLDQLRHQLEVNVVGQVAVIQACVEQLRRARGRVVNIGSIGGRNAAPFIGPYSASKFALEAITDSLRRELRPWGIEVAVIEPGAVATPIWDKGVQQAKTQASELPPRALDLYGSAMDALTGLLAQQAGNGIDPQQVARAVTHALTAKRPRTRYLVGREARMTALMVRVLPDRAMDRLIIKLMRLS